MKFAFVIHPLSNSDLSRYAAWTKLFPGFMLEKMMVKKKPQVVSHITGIKSKTGATTEGWFIGLPLTPKLMMQDLPLEDVYERIIRCCELAADEGASVIGLGAFSSVVGDGGITIASKSPIAVTTGNSYTVETAIEGSLAACSMVGIIPSNATLAVVGATGSIGQACSRILAPKFGNTILVGRDITKARQILKHLDNATATTSLEEVKKADLVITVTSSETAVLEPKHFKTGAVVCDVARPRDVSNKVAKQRDDILVIEGGVVRVPGENVNFRFDFGFPEHTAYACMCETMMLALEQTAENFTLGKSLTVKQVEQTRKWSKKHGFELAGFRSFEQALSNDVVQRVANYREYGAPVPASIK